MVASASSSRQQRHPRRLSVPTDVGGRPTVVDLRDAGALDVALVGTKAANLARSADEGLPVLPGFVVTTAACQGDVLALTEVRAAYDRLSAGGVDPVVVRSSSPVEDGERSSMAGRFVSVLDVVGWDRFCTAVLEVVGSGRTVALQDGRVTVEMAVLVQPQLAARLGGVLFGVDPVSGRTDRLAVAAVAGGPDQLVSGAADGARVTLSRRGRLLDVDGDPHPAVLLTRRHRRGLARLARSAAGVFGGPQDNEWAVDDRGRLWLLQSRPITAVASAASGPVLGPGPVAETFPDPLTPLEQDLWLDPLRDAITVAVGLTGSVSRRRLARSPVVLAVGGRAAVDLELVGVVQSRGGVLAKLDPRPPARRLRAAWRTGRLRTALPALAADLVAQTDAELRSVGDLTVLTTDELVTLLGGCRRALVALHGQEILSGLLLPAGDDRGSGAAVALRTRGPEGGRGRRRRDRGPPSGRARPRPAGHPPGDASAATRRPRPGLRRSGRRRRQPT
jgi:rifampicin phosphotransferase